MKRFSINHVFQYRLTPAVAGATVVARLAPRSVANQTLEASALACQPAAHSQRQTVDDNGNTLDKINIVGEIPKLDIATHAVVSVDTARRRDVTHSWQASRPVWIAGECASSHATIRRFAENWSRGAADLAALLESVTCQAASALRYDSLTARPGQPLDDALKRRMGVCQDYAHLAIAVLRALSVPASYIAGYVPARPGQAQDERKRGMHAWVGIRSAEFGWIFADPTRGTLDCVDYIACAIGNGYWDTAPMTGSFSSVTRAEQTATILVRSLDDQASC